MLSLKRLSVVASMACAACAGGPTAVTTATAAQPDPTPPAIQGAAPQTSVNSAPTATDDGRHAHTETDTADVANPTEPPPANRVENHGARKGYVWIPGRWSWPGHWVWVEGGWEPEHADMAWTEGRWELRGSDYVWSDGRWAELKR
jgi:hypothetical protein